LVTTSTRPIEQAGRLLYVVRLSGVLGALRSLFVTASTRPIARSPRWAERVNKPLTAAKLKAVRNSGNCTPPLF
jgi:hypothetical protein